MKRASLPWAPPSTTVASSTVKSRVIAPGRIVVAGVAFIGGDHLPAAVLDDAGSPRDPAPTKTALNGPENSGPRRTVPSWGSCAGLQRRRKAARRKDHRRGTGHWVQGPRSGTRRDLGQAQEGRPHGVGLLDGLHRRAVAAGDGPQRVAAADLVHPQVLLGPLRQKRRQPTSSSWARGLKARQRGRGPRRCRGGPAPPWAAEGGSPASPCPPLRAGASS